MICYKAHKRRATPDIMGVSWREYVQEKQKKLTPVQRFRENAGLAAPKRTEAEERAAIRAKYFRVARARYHKEIPAQMRMEDYA